MKFEVGDIVKHKLDPHAGLCAITEVISHGHISMESLKSFRWVTRPNYVGPHTWTAISGEFIELVARKSEITELHRVLWNLK